MSGPSIHLRLPPLSLFKFPPDPVPYALPPPSDERTFKSPFPIDATLYNAVLDWRVPVTIASVYAVTVTVWNKLNRDRNHRPWAISKTRAFRAFVILHNIALALFSALTFVAMMRALRHSWPGRYERHGFGIWWPTWRTENGLAGAADALCKPNGPRGLGDAAYFNATSNVWETKNTLIHLAENGSPDPTDVGRLWNEGVSFWGWFFYLSKFYEVLDTAIILLKGKRSSFLQTYHHAGAMFCMWAGIRYMSPPIWMFCWLNSGIHALMVGSLKQSQVVACIADSTVQVHLLHTLRIGSPRATAYQTHPHNSANLSVLHGHHLCSRSSLHQLLGAGYDDLQIHDYREVSRIGNQFCGIRGHKRRDCRHYHCRCR